MKHLLSILIFFSFVSVVSAETTFVTPELPDDYFERKDYYSERQSSCNGEYDIFKDICIPAILILKRDSPLNYWMSEGYKITDISEGALGVAKIYTLTNKKEVRICKVFMKNNSTQCFKP